MNQSELAKATLFKSLIIHGYEHKHDLNEDEILSDNLLHTIPPSWHQMTISEIAEEESREWNVNGRCEGYSKACIETPYECLKAWNTAAGNLNDSPEDLATWGGGLADELLRFFALVDALQVAKDANYPVLTAPVVPVNTWNQLGQITGKLEWNDTKNIFINLCTDAAKTKRGNLAFEISTYESHTCSIVYPRPTMNNHNLICCDVDGVGITENMNLKLALDTLHKHNENFWEDPVKDIVIYSQNLITNNLSGLKGAQNLAIENAKKSTLGRQIINCYGSEHAKSKIIKY